MTRASGRSEHNRSPTPQRLPPGAQVSFAAPMKTGAIGLCAGESCISVEFWDEFAAIMKGMYGDTGAGNEAAGAASGRQLQNCG